MSRQTSILSMGVTYRCMGISHSLGVDKKRPFFNSKFNYYDVF